MNEKTEKANESQFDIFRKKYAYFVLMMIRYNPGITKTDLMRNQQGAHSIFLITCELHKIGLIKYVQDPDDRGKRGRCFCLHMYLTDKGQKVAAYLEKISKELDEKPTSYVEKYPI